MAESLLLTALNSGAISVGTAAAASSAMSILPSAATALSVGSAVGQIAGGFQEQAYYKSLSKQSELSARQEELKGREQADKIRNTLLSTVASQRAMFAARGLSLGSGTFKNIQSQAYDAATRDIETARFGSALAAEQERLQGKQYKISGKAALMKGFAGAGGAFAGRSLLA